MPRDTQNDTVRVGAEGPRDSYRFYERNLEAARAMETENCLTIRGVVSYLNAAVADTGDNVGRALFVREDGVVMPQLNLLIQTLNMACENERLVDTNASLARDLTGVFAQQRSSLTKKQWFFVVSLLCRAYRVKDCTPYGDHRAEYPNPVGGPSATAREIAERREAQMTGTFLENMGPAYATGGEVDPQRGRPECMWRRREPRPGFVGGLRALRVLAQRLREGSETAADFAAALGGITRLDRATGGTPQTNDYHTRAGAVRHNVEILSNPGRHLGADVTTARNALIEIGENETPEYDAHLIGLLDEINTASGYVSAARLDDLLREIVDLGETITYDASRNLHGIERLTGPVHTGPRPTATPEPTARRIQSEHRVHRTGGGPPEHRGLCGTGGTFGGGGPQEAQEPAQTEPAQYHNAGGGFQNIRAMFDTARRERPGRSGPQMEIGNEELTIYLFTMRRGRNAGSVGIRSTRGYSPDADFYGRIDGGGRLRASRNMTDEIIDLLIDLNASPEVVVGAYGQRTGRCSFCARELTDARSVTVGYGPVCAGYYGLPWGGTPTD